MLVGLIVGLIGAEFILEHTNIAQVNFVQELQRKTRGLKVKKVIEYGLLLIVSIVLWGLMAQSVLGTIPQGMIVGIIWALVRFVFEDTVFDQARNTLR
ncbi:MAG: hypothetical protein E7231_11885 [Cellulosilyticum sp.]|nr:hypothetical protein [Cellulosilyticum sp.]